MKPKLEFPWNKERLGSGKLAVAVGTGNERLPLNLLPNLQPCCCAPEASGASHSLSNFIENKTPQLGNIP
ncbi:MAG: hypothetical protein WBA61_04225 [Aequorivita sp.]